MPFEPIQLPRQAIEPPRQSGFHPLILIGLQQGHQRRFHHFGARDAAGMSAFLQQFGQFDIEPEGLFAVGLLPHRSMPSSGSSDALRALRFIVRSASRFALAASSSGASRSRSNSLTGGLGAGTTSSCSPSSGSRPVSYTHLDVYKRQLRMMSSVSCVLPISNPLICGVSAFS